jgi:ABC-type dipeptide/oligopeptide/nickel transport system permease subunit
MSPDLLRLASEAIQRGEKADARKMVAQALLADPRNEQAWLLMARLVYNRGQVIDCLEHASKINPTNFATLSALRTMKRGKPAQVGSLLPETRITPGHSRYMVSEKPIAVDKKAGQKPIALSFPETTAETIQPPKHRLNKSLIFGSMIVLIVVLIAIIGPKLAPQDPMEEHAILHVGDEWIIPPFNAFQVPGFLLGSDRFGRDMLSRILYAVRPTLIMVSIVAMVRLFLGIFIGLSAGWSNGRLGHFLNGLISAALAIPVLLVALGAITVIGAEKGLVAFIIGLSINGWGETARLVDQQTQLIKGQLFIESARSLGVSNIQILGKHILRQIMPMVWMLLAFEVSSTLMVTAGLGFLGYYIGGDIWIEVDDFVSRRTSGAPELGQMLATSWGSLMQSWPLVLTGFIIFITVLGFNLIGQGLRARLNPEFINRNNPLSLIGRRFSMWFEESISYPTSQWFKANRLRPALLILIVVAITTTSYLYQAKFANHFNPSQAALTVPGGQIWAAEKVDPYGTYYINSIGPASPNRLWTINNPAGFSGSPAISTDGTIYVAGLDGTLWALNPDGTTRWQVSLPEIPLGPLAIGSQGTIYVTDSTGGLSAFNTDGNLLWKYSVEVTGKPNHGAIVDPKGTVYYLIETQLGDILNALQPDGKLLWSIKPGTRAATTGLRLSPDGKQIYVKNVVVSSQDGSLVELTLPSQDNAILSDQAHLLVGADGKTYLLTGHEIIQWTQTSQGFTIMQKVNWNYRGEGISQNSGFPEEAGVTPMGDIWLYYPGIYGGGASVYWLDPTGKIIGSFSSRFSASNQLVAIDGNSTVYNCGIGFSTVQGQVTMCEAYPQNASIPGWSYNFEGTEGIVGAAIAPGRLYVITPDGTITALGDSRITPPSETIAP